MKTHGRQGQSASGRKKTPQGSHEPEDLLSPFRSWTAYLLAIVAILAGVDRQTFTVLLVPIQKDLGVSDAAMGALTGASFAIVYAIAALPLASLADRVNRRNLLAVVVTIWSAATALCGLAGSYGWLLLARMGVAGAEAAQTPASISLIADRFATRHRGVALAFVFVGLTIGYALGSTLAGYLSDRFGWQIALMCVAAPGLLVALAVRFTITEPKRGGAHGEGYTPTGMMDVLRQCARTPSLYLIALASIATQAASQGWATWTPAFLMRVHGMSATSMGALFGVIILGAVLSNFFAGSASDRLAIRSPTWRPYLCALICFIAIFPLTFSVLVEDLGSAVFWEFFYTIVSGGLATASAAAYVSLAAPHMRGTVTALVQLFSSLIGGVLGPILFGLVNDVLKTTHGEEALRITLLLAPAFMAAGCLLYVLSARTFTADLRAMHESD